MVFPTPLKYHHCLNTKNDVFAFFIYNDKDYYLYLAVSTTLFTTQNEKFKQPPIKKQQEQWFQDNIILLSSPNSFFIRRS